MDNIEKYGFQQYVAGLLKKEGLNSFMDIGCGCGNDLEFFKEKLGSNPGSRYVGVDKNEKSISSACENYSKYGLEFYTMDIADRLDFADDSFDIVYSANAMECIKDKSKHINEIHRILKPGGQVVCCHCDWDSIMYNGEDKGNIKEIMNKYSNWQQPWMNDADSWMGRRLWGFFNRNGMFFGDIRVFNIIETDYSEGCKG